MKVNMGKVDRRVRAFIVAPVLIILAVAVFGVGSVAGIIALVLAAVMLATSAVGNCPLYSIVGVSTCQNGPASAAH